MAYSIKPSLAALASRYGESRAYAICEEGREAVAVCRSIMGSTDGAKAPPATIRGDFALSVQNNLVHGSDSPENAALEIALWFRPDELTTYTTTDANWVA